MLAAFFAKINWLAEFFLALFMWLKSSLDWANHK